MSLDYEFLEEIGRGIAGIVYRGLDLKNKREVAIKSVFSNKEIENHKKISKLLNCVPAYYDDFIFENKKYIVMELISGQGLHDAWRDNRNWDFAWMTVYHVLNVIKEFHKTGYSHNDMHINNFVWNGSKLYLIDFDKLYNIAEKIQILELSKEEIKANLPEDWELTYDYDPYEKINNKIYDTINSNCYDISDAITNKNFTRLGNIEEFTNVNYGLEKYEALLTFKNRTLCADDPNYINILIQEYKRLDSE